MDSPIDSKNLASTSGLASDSTSRDSESSNSSQDNSDNEDQTNNETAKSRDKSLHVSVRRSVISSTTVREGNNELQNLGVEVYDQQTYEEGVYDQVNKALDAADEANQRRNNNAPGTNSSNINDLIRLIHDNNTPQEGQNEEETQDPSERDEQVLQMTRAQRLNRTQVKIEPEEPPNEESHIRSLPRIPKISTIKRELNVSQPERLVLATEDTSRHKPSLPRPKSKRFETLSSGIRLEHDQEESDSDSSRSEYQPQDDELEDDDEEEIDYETDSDESGKDDVGTLPNRRSKKRPKIDDDGDFNCYKARVKSYTKERARMRLANILPDGTEVKKLDEMTKIDGDLQIPKEMWDNLFEHQKTGVRWLWELHQLGTGGILGDEMGLGKTIQMIAFLTALKCSNIHNIHNGYESLGPTVLVCPATVMHQWLMEFRKWWPQFRVAILHSTGTFAGDRKHLVNVIHKSNGILIVSYPGVVIYQDYLHKLDWHYAILDEGHKIRNPDAQVTLACKRFRTPHRIILSGSPVQNNLKELWSIFDFIYPGKLGTLPVFMGQFGIPITQGGYANATDIQVQIAYKCACVLRDTIKPFLLRRTKAEVNNKLKLPERSEQVLFCKLSEKQRKMYQAYLESPTVRDIKRGVCQIFVGLIQLRKICNHPDIFDSTECQNQIKQKEVEHIKKHLEFFSEDETYGHYKKSGKMIVVDALLKLWKKQNHKVLLFTQSRQMLKVFMNYMDEFKYKYLTMDGATPIGARQTMIDEFNNNEEIFIFLLTTRVGGVGINLIGANRIIIYDPDWNPSTDIQARERAWRIGQQRHVIIYRLLTAGTIEEKIYHRQVFKLYLTNRVLKDAKQKRFFKTNDMHELFTLGDNDKNIETKALFDEDLQINQESINQARKMKRKSKENKSKKHKKDKRRDQGDHDDSSLLTEAQREALRDRAKRLSQMIALQYGSKSDDQQAIVKQDMEDSASKQSHHTKEHQDSEPKKRSETDIEKSVRLRDKSKKGIKLDYLVKQDVYRPSSSTKEEQPDPRYKRDDYILDRLFKSSNISGALKHDKIETDTAADFKVVESEAEKVARDAIRALRESRRLCLGSTSGIPNWTGRNGQVADTPRLVPKNKRASQQASCSTSSPNTSKDSLLASIKKRNQLNSVPLAESTFGTGPRDSDEEADQNRAFEGRAKESGADGMAGKIREYLLFKSARNGEAQTDELLEMFKQNFQSDKTAIFKAILYKICEFQRRGDKGFWVLKNEFRS